MKPDELFKNALIYGTSHPEAYMTKADELWQKWFDGEAYGEPVMSHAGFLAALKEYGESVRQQAVSVCRDMRHPDDFTPESGQWFVACEDCSAAIERMETK